MRREYLWALITLIGAVVLALVLLNLMKDDPRGEGAPLAQCTADDEAKIKRMMGRGFDQAFQGQIASLYKTYVGNAPSVQQQQQFTKTGIDNAITAWRIGVSAAEAWGGCK